MEGLERFILRILFKDTEAHENYNEGLLEDVKESSSANYNNDLVKMLALRASSTYDLNRTKAREYARKWATTPPYCDSKRYQYIPHVAPGNFDCTNFASQVLHEAEYLLVQRILPIKIMNGSPWVEVRLGVIHGLTLSIWKNL